MKTHAGEIAAKLQGAHARRMGREDEDMSEDESITMMDAATAIAREATTEQVAQIGSSVWDDDPMVHAMKLAERLGTVLGDLAASGDAPGEEQARIAELEEKVRLYDVDRHTERDRAIQLTQERDELRTKLAQAESAGLGEGYEHEGTRVELLTARELLATAYVTREVPWSDVAAGMMTIARDGTAWMVENVLDGDPPVAYRLRNGGKTFTKTPKHDETVRVLVPYVTPEAAEALVREQLGATDGGGHASPVG